MRGITGLVVTTVVAGGLWFGSAPAGAIAPGAADLAADCNDDGLVVITKHAHYHGGTGLITRDCRVDISAGARFFLTKVTLLSKCCFFVINPAGHDSDVLVLDSRTDLAGALQLVSGCCGGDEPGEENGRVRVRRSNLVAASIEIGASVSSPNGHINVRDSRLRATAPSIGASIILRASSGAFGIDGTAIVSDSELISPSGIHVATGRRGSTTASSNAFTAGGPVVITTGPEGTCTSVGNVPDVPCS